MGALIDVVELSGTIFSEVKTYEIDVSMTMHGRSPYGLVAAGVVRIEWYQFQSLVPVDFQGGCITDAFLIHLILADLPTDECIHTEQIIRNEISVQCITSISLSR